MFQKGDLIKFIKPPNRSSLDPNLKDYVGTIAVVFNSEMKPVYPNNPKGYPSSRLYEKITIYSPATKRIVTSPATYWQLIEEANKCSRKVI